MEEKRQLAGNALIFNGINFVNSVNSVPGSDGTQAHLIIAEDR